MDPINKIYRQRWQRNRSQLEKENRRVFPMHEQRKIPRRDPMSVLFKIFGWFLRLTGLYKTGLKTAKKVTLTENTWKSPFLAGKELRLLHLSDLHLDESPVPLDNLLWTLKEAEPYHFCFITGDIATGWPLDKETEDKLKELVAALKPLKKTIAVLGNHDSAHLVGFLEGLGVTVLTNQFLSYEQDPDLPCSLQIVGTDDPHYFYQKDASTIFQEGKPHLLRLALVHTPELFDQAQKHQTDFYFCGHTHGGQIAFPGGRPIIKRVYRGKKFAKGAWQFHTMRGYTSSGVGTSSLPVRFFTKAEVILHRIV